MVPRAHGAWVMFAMPFVVAGGVAGRFDLPATLLVTASLALFLADAPLESLVRGRHRPRATRYAGIYCLVGCAAGSVLLVEYRPLILIPFGLFALAVLVIRLTQVALRSDRSVGVELLSVTAFSSSAPATYAVLTGHLNGTALLLWGLHALFFGSSVFYVKFRVQSVSRRGRETGPDFGRVTLLYHTALALLVSVLSATGQIPVLAAVAFLPIVFRALWAVIRRPDRLRLGLIGATETGFVVLFATLLVASYHTVC